MLVFYLRQRRTPSSTRTGTRCPSTTRLRSAAPHDLDAFMTLLKRDGTMPLVGVPATPHPSPQVFNLVGKRGALAGSMIGGIPETQEMLDFCAEHGIVADIEMIRADQVNEAYERMLASDVKYRFVMENSTLGDAA